MEKYIIGTGWWCDGSGTHTHSKHQPYVDKKTRQVEFFDLWYKSVMKFTNPHNIVVIDSNDVFCLFLDKRIGIIITINTKHI